MTIRDKTHMTLRNRPVVLIIYYFLIKQEISELTKKKQTKHSIKQFYWIQSTFVYFDRWKSLFEHYS